MKTLVHRYWKYATIVMSVILAGNIYENYTTKQTLKDIYHYDIEITVVDKDTGDRVKSISSGGPSSSSEDLFQQSSGISSLGDGRIALSGVAYEPRLWHISSNGYDEVSVTIDRDSPSHLRIELTKK